MDVETELDPLDLCENDLYISIYISIIVTATAVAVFNFHPAKPTIHRNPSTSRRNIQANSDPEMACSW